MNVYLLIKRSFGGRQVLRIVQILTTTEFKIGG